MKKILGIAVLGLLLNPSSFAEEPDLNISVKKAFEETDIIKIDENYSIKCEADADDYNMIFSSKVVNSKVLRSEGVFNFGDDGSMYLKIDAKINSKGKLTKGKVKINYSPDMDKDFKKEFKNFEPFFKEMVSDSFLSFSIYGKTLLPIKIEDKKQSKKILNMLKKLFATDKELKKFSQGLKLYSYDHYLGTTLIDEENFYVVKTFISFESPNEEINEFLEEMEESEGLVYTFIHINSGFAIQAQQEFDTICTINVQGKELIKVDSSDLAF